MMMVMLVLITNTKGYTLKLDTDTELGHVSNVVQAHDLGCNQTETGKWSPAAVKVVSACNTTAKERGEKLMDMLCKEDIPRSGMRDQQEKHEAFAVSETEQGQTDLI